MTARVKMIKTEIFAKETEERRIGSEGAGLDNLQTGYRLPKEAMPEKWTYSLGKQLPDIRNVTIEMNVEMLGWLVPWGASGTKNPCIFEFAL